MRLPVSCGLLGRVSPLPLGQHTQRMPRLTICSSNSSVLTRLSNIEARLQSIDQSITVAPPAERGARGGSSDNAWPKMPDFHHASAHKLFHCWPKLRISLANLDIEPVTFFKNVDDADTFNFENNFDTTDLGGIHVSEATSSISALFENVSQLPFILRHLLTTGGLTREVCLGLFNRYSDFSTGYDVRLQFETQSAEELLVQTVAFKHLSSTSMNVSLSRQADLCFKFALGRMWMIQSRQNPQILPFKFLFVICLLYVYGRPFHALGLLQSLEPQIHNASPMMRGDL